MSNTKQVDFKIDSFSVKNFSLFKNDKECSEVNFLIDLKIHLDPKLKRILLELFIKASNKKNQEAFASFETETIYEFLDFEIFNDNGEYKIPQELTTTLVSIAYSTSRGALLLTGKGTILEKEILPLINPNDFFKAQA